MKKGSRRRVKERHVKKEALSLKGYDDWGRGPQTGRGMQGLQVTLFERLQKGAQPH